MNTSVESEVIDLKFPGRFKFGLTSAVSVLVAIGSIGVTAFWLYSDKRNSEMFLPRVEYRKDQDQYQKDQQSIAISLQRLEKNQADGFAKFEKMQDEFRQDIKSILREPRHP